MWRACALEAVIINLYFAKVTAHKQYNKMIRKVVQYKKRDKNYKQKRIHMIFNIASLLMTELGELNNSRMNKRQFSATYLTI